MQKVAVLLTILMGLLNGWRTMTLIQQRDLLLTYGSKYPPALLISAALLWTVLFLTLGGVGWRNPRAVWLPIPLTFLVYTLYNVWLPTPTFPFLYGHLFMLIFTALTLRFGNRKKHMMLK